MLKLSRAPTRTPPPPPQAPPPRPNPLQHRTIPILFGSIALLAFSSYGTYLYITLTRPPATPIPSAPSAQPDVSWRYDTIARGFDETVDFPESLLRIKELRKKLLFKAQGDVLEVSIGTGRNLEYYDWGLEGQAGPQGKKGKVRSFTAVDISGGMLGVAREKFSRLFPENLGTRWIVADASKEVPSAPGGVGDKQGGLGGRKYDTVVQTMGLCSADDPVALLKNLGNCVKEGDGRILLLEHGRGNLEWLNGVLDNFSEAHAKEFGCWWNRDLEKIVSESGLDVVDMHSIWWHGGTTWWIELRRPKASLPNSTAGLVGSSKPQVDEGAKRKWW